MGYEHSGTSFAASTKSGQLAGTLTLSTDKIGQCVQALRPSSVAVLSHMGMIENRSPPTVHGPSGESQRSSHFPLVVAQPGSVHLGSPFLVVPSYSTHQDLVAG